MKARQYFDVSLMTALGDLRLWRLSTGRPILPGSIEVLIEALAPALVDASNMTYLITSSDSLLKQALESISIMHIGTVCDPSDLQSLLPRETVTPEVKFKLAQLLKPGNTTGPLFVFKAHSNVTHPFSLNADEYLWYCRQRERYLLGLSSSELEQVYEGTQPISGQVETAYRNRVTSDFSILTSRRHSSSGFSHGFSVDRKTIDAVLQDSIYVRADGHLPFPTAGGFRCIQPLVIVERASDITAGSYDVNIQTRTWEPRAIGLTGDTIRTLGFSQPWFQDCVFWIVPVLNLSGLSQKYGPRSYRFGHMAVGSFIQQVHLSCTSFGLGCRVLGGFDDAAVSVLSGIDLDKEMIAAFIGVGLER